MGTSKEERELARTQERVRKTERKLAILRARALTKERHLVKLLHEGFARIWEDLNPKATIVCAQPGDPDYHQCEDISILFRGVDPQARARDSGFGPIGGPCQRPPLNINSTDGVEICISCQYHRGPPARMHRLRCGHYFCRFCLQHKASTSMWAGERGSDADMRFETTLRRVGRQMYDSRDPAYAGDLEEKNALIMMLWDHLGWTCCGQPIPFDKFIKMGCLAPVTAVKHLDIWGRAVRIITTIGGRIILEMLDPLWDLETEEKEEVAVLRVKGKKELEGLEALEGIKYINPFERTEENPKGWTSHIPCLSAMSEARIKKGIEDEIALSKWIV